MENDKDCIEDSLDSDNEDFASFGPENTDHTLLTYSIYIYENLYCNAQIEKADRTQIDEE